MFLAFPYNFPLTLKGPNSSVSTKRDPKIYFFSIVAKRIWAVKDVINRFDKPNTFFYLDPLTMEMRKNMAREYSTGRISEG